MSDFDVLLSPLTIKKVTIRNRIMSTAHSSGFVQDGLPRDQYLAYQEEKAKGGVGLTMVAGTSSVTPDSPGKEAGHVDVGTDDVIPHFQRLAQAVTRHGASVFAQIGHMGRRAIWDRDNWFPVISASHIREPVNHSFPKEMEDWDIRRVVRGFGEAARRCELGGMQGVEVGGGFSHLVEQFLSPLVNVRTDAYGGSLENRMRFLIELLTAMRESVSDDYVIGFRMSADELRKGGITPEEGIAIARTVVGRGLVDYLSIIAGEGENHISHPTVLPGMSYPVAPFLHIASAVKAEVDVPIFHAGRITDLNTAARAVADGHIDMVGMTRAHMADPYIVKKLTEGRMDDIRPCIGANYCIDRFYVHGQARCIHNPATGREETMPQVITRQAERKKKIVVVGAGPAGLEAARVTASRGHDVVLFEALEQTGGQVLVASKAPRREALANITQWLDLQIRKLGVDLRLGVEADSQAILAEEPDVVIVATGGTPHLGWFKGIEHAVSTWSILSGAVAPANNVLLYDDNGDHQAPSCAEFMLDRGASVELVTPDRAIGQDIGLTKAALYRRELYKREIILTPDQRLTEIYPEGNKLIAVLTNCYTEVEEERAVDQVVTENGVLPRDKVYFDLKPLSNNGGEFDLYALIEGCPQAIEVNGEGRFQLFRVGDAVAGRNIHGAIYDALRLCKDI